MEQKNKLTLLGIWNVMPLLAWPWFSDKSVNYFQKITGFKMKSFTFVKNNLHHQYFLIKSTDALYNNFNSLTDEKQKKYVNRLCNDYYVNAKRVEKFIKNIEKNDYKKFSDLEFIKVISEWCNLFSKLTMSIWFVVLLDIWYPFPNQKSEVKKIGAKARDKDGYLHKYMQEVMKKIFICVAKRLKITTNDIYFLFPEEIIMSLSGKPLKRPNIRNRKEFCVTTNILGRYRVYEGTKARSLLGKFYSVSMTKKVDLLKGMPAFAGKVKGRVHKILTDKDFKTFRRNEILVALQTMVHYVPIMKKAKAILTEFGGITSHAAIVSRELKKPCIVGISGLTASVTNGDLVEVDANKGIARILN